MIEPNAKRIEELLTTSVQYVIPKYQRQYEWGREEATEFIADLNEHSGADGDSLFLGTIIFDTTDSDNNKICVVDGQQRMTTILLLLIACRQLAKKLNEFSLANLIQQKVTFVNGTTGESEGAKLIVSESIRDIFEYISNSEWDGNFPDAIESGNNKKNPIKKSIKRQVKKIQPIYEFFFNSISNYDKKKLGAFLKSLHNAYVVRINIQKQEEAFNIFERTNARGLDLAASDLLKNHLFSTGAEKTDESWSAITENADGSILRMLKYFYVAKKGGVSKSQLYKKIKLYSNTIGVETLLKELVEFSEFYRQIQTADEKGITDYLQRAGCNKIAGDEDKYPRIYYSIQGLRFFKVMQVYPVIYSAIQCFIRSGFGDESKKSNSLVNFFQTLEKYHFINNAICTRVGNEVEKLYENYCLKFADSDDFIKTSDSFRQELTKKLATKGEFVGNFVEIAYTQSSKPLIAYIFDRINNDGLSPSQRVKIFNPDPKLWRWGYNVEHFYPQRPAKGKLLPSDSLDSIGNLLMISLNTNSKWQNKSPEEKFAMMSNGDGVWNLPYVQTFVQKYSNKNWDEEIIRERAKDLASEAYDKVWKIN